MTVLKEKMCKIWIIILFCVSLHVHTCDGSAWLQDPPSRSAAWYYQIKTPVNYNFRNLDCGSVPVKINSDGSRNCGLCGDPYTDPSPRDNELGGKYANPRVRTRYYESGQVAEISLWNNLPGALGFYEFRLCDEDMNQTQACLDKHLLTIRDTGKTYMPVPNTQGLVMVHVELPPGVTCDYCLLQWRFRKESLAGCDDENWCGVGRGAQIEFYNCADVMIGAVGQPKPTFIQDPVYTSSDYGSAYDVATTRTTPDGSNLVNNLTTPKTTSVPIFTIPTVFPTGTTSNPTTSSRTTNNPISTSGTTNGPVTINTPGTTKPVTVGPVPDDSRLVVDSNGNAIAGQSITSGGSSGNGKYVFALLSLLPILGALGLENSRQGVGAPLPPVPPSAPVTWARALPVYPLQIENTFGFGNFGAGNLAFIGTGGYGGDKETYTSSSGYSTGYHVNSARASNLNNFAVTSGSLNSFNSNSGRVGHLPVNSFNSKIYPKNNIGQTQFVQNPVVWKNNGVAMNQGFQSHVFPRSVRFQSGTPYQPNPSLYSKPSGIVKNPLPRDEYGSSQQPAGYAPHSNIAPKVPVSQTQTEVNWPRNTVQTINTWQSSGFRNWQNSGINTGLNNWQTNTGLGTISRVQMNGVGAGQRLPVSETITQRMRTINSVVTQSDNSFPLQGIESASRFRINNPRQITENSQPAGKGFAFVQNGDNEIHTASTQTTFNNFNPDPLRTGRFFVNDWYDMLFKRLPTNPQRSL